MSAVTILAPGEDLLEEIVSRLSPPQQDFSKDLVVFPGKRPAHALRRKLAERVGSSFLPPNIYSVDTFVEFLHNKCLNINKPTLTSLDAVAVLFDLHRDLSQRLGRDAYITLDAFLPVGLKLVAELEELMLADLSERRLREVLTNVPYGKFHSLGAYYEAFYREVERRGYATRATMYRTVAERMGEVDWSGYRTIILAGFCAFTKVEKKIVAHLSERENVTLLFQHGIGLQKQLQTVGLSLEEEPPVTGRSDLHFIKAPDLHGQAFALAAQLQEQINAGAPVDQRTAIVLPSSEALFPVLHFALSLLPEESYNIALQYPLTRTPVYGFLSSLMDFVASAHNGKFSSAEYLKFVLHPYTKNIRFGQQTEVTRVFFHSIEEHFSEHYAKALFSLEELERDEKLYQEVERRLAGAGVVATQEELRRHLETIHSNTVRKIASASTVGQLAERAMELLSYIFAHSTANLHPYFRPYVQRMMEVLDGVRTSLLAGHSFGEQQASFLFLQQCIAAESIPFPGTPLKGLQVLGLLETRNLTFDTLYLLDATDDILPGKPAQDMLLPQGIRAMLELETYHEAERLVEYYFDLAVRSAKRVFLFYSESGEREKSRFVQKLLWQLQQENKSATDEYEQRVKYRVRLVNDRPEAVAKTTEMVETLRANMRFSAHALDTYLACPLKFYYQYLLKLGEREEVTDEMGATDLGQLVHGILARYFEPLRDQRLGANNLGRERLQRVGDACFEETFGKEIT
ncbi:MAG: PD-(D/E)XK nuclease family protein, partial [Bacteroidota bacterium]